MSAALNSDERSGLDIHGSRTRAWWMQAVAGQLEQSHPIHGTDVRASVQGGVLRLRGVVPSQRDLDQLLAEAEEFRGNGINEVDSEVRVEENADVAGVYRQTLISGFESAEQCAFAANYLESHAHIDPHFMTTVEPGSSAEALGLVVPAELVPDVARSLEEGRVVLVVTIDETSAFKARQLLEEETPSLYVVSAPPRAMPGAERRMAESETT